MTSFMEAIPVELEEAAVMDGCGIYRILFQIITPMLKSSIATVAIMTFLNNWNEFMMATTYLSSPKWKTLPFSVLEFTGEYSSNYAVQFAVMALTAAPAVIVYIALNKHITKGAAMGAVTQSNMTGIHAVLFAVRSIFCSTVFGSYISPESTSDLSIQPNIA